LTTNAAEKVLTTLGELNSQLLLSGAPTAATTNYTIQPGDTLGGIARTFGTTIDLLQRANGLASDTIRAGRRLSVCLSKFTVDVSKTANTLTVTDSGAFFKRYRVGTGQFNKTPVGEFKITNRAEHPVWYRPDGKTVPYGDPDNILGTHWLGLNVAGYGLHGTWETNSIGKQSSAGCIRLLNDDIAELYTILPVGTPVTIHE
jgi:lipoprotein-anchoring transpeptidase ErfK/SrfK